MNDVFFMEEALSLAKEAAALDEIPIGAVIVLENRIIGRGLNRNRSENDPTCHAEIEAIREACKTMGNERLTGARLYVTKEPCAMCSGAIIHARIAKVIIGAEDMRYGACGTVFNICGNEKMNHRPEIRFGIFREESSELLKSFFRAKRKKSNDQVSCPDSDIESVNFRDH